MDQLKIFARTTQKMDNYYINSKYCSKIPTDKYKIYINDKEFNKELDSQYVFGYLFTAKSLDHGIINKEMRLLYKGESVQSIRQSIGHSFF